MITVGPGLLNEGQKTEGGTAHEAFIFPGENGFNFCKTQWKPYDAVVIACLFAARDYFSPDQLEIASDGEDDPDAFEAGRQLYAETFCASQKTCSTAAGTLLGPALEWLFCAGSLSP